MAMLDDEDEEEGGATVLYLDDPLFEEASRPMLLLCVLYSVYSVYSMWSHTGGLHWGWL